MTYNDNSVLENYHLSTAFKIIRNPSTNIFANMSLEEFRTVRRFLIACVLATDMTKHSEIVTHASDKLDNMAEDHIFFLSTLLHAADISHPCRPWEMHEHWTHMVAEEFF